MQVDLKLYNLPKEIQSALLKHSIIVDKNDYLSSNALLDNVYVKYFDIKSLSIEPSTRIQGLFCKKSKFTLNEMEIYLKGLNGSQREILEKLVSSTKTIQETILSANKYIFEKVHPLESESLADDRLNTGNFTYKSYVSKF